MSLPPTGEQHVLRAGDAEAVVVEVGGGLRTYRAGGRDVVDGFGPGEMAADCRGQVLAPWPNRLRDGVWSWDGTGHVTPVTEPERGAALHGLVRYAAWRVLGRSDDAVVLEHLLHPQPGYPFSLRLQVGYELSTGGLRVSTTATNEGDADLPYGEGHHPYLASPSGLLDGDELTVPAATRIVPDERLLPVGTEPVEGTPYDLRAGRRLGDLRLDDCFTDLARDADGVAEVRLTGPDGHGAAVWMDASYRYLQLFSADVVEPASRRRQGLAVEPMTCPPDAFRSGEAVRRLAPGESTTSTWGIRPL
ncbi:aldose 1-epimerase [Geodermatophilus bullaregiensis]|uniref:aldose 1-epimerase family protein n=1 Tax=Geodermatophilus bullaregiensis TaxID=1564160 RepID=UPI001959D654|nr:aldose 1-epimerase family protein [Geodermatophilus bullaregiensis]MBM7804516.1 aldose 1-epimerase [Geodermatophilus bullaregiensis]